MKTIEFIADFAHADDGIHARRYAAGDIVDVSDGCAAAALETGAGREPGNGPVGSKAGEAPASSSSAQAPAPESNTGPAASTASPRRKKKAAARSKSSR